MSGEVAGWTPAFAGQRPPFQPGHELSIRSGAWSPRHVEPRAAELVEQLLAMPGIEHLAEPSFRPAVWAWARAEARVQLLAEWVDEMSMQDATESAGGRTPPLELLRRWESTALTQRGRLGLDPMSRARLMKDRAQGGQAALAAQARLERLAEQGAAAAGRDAGRLAEGGASR